MADKNDGDGPKGDGPRATFCPTCDQVQEVDKHGKCRACGEQIIRDPKISE